MTESLVVCDTVCVCVVRVFFRSFFRSFFARQGRSRPRRSLSAEVSLCTKVLCSCFSLAWPFSFLLAGPSQWLAQHLSLCWLFQDIQLTWKPEPALTALIRPLWRIGGWRRGEWMGGTYSACLRIFWSNNSSYLNTWHPRRGHMVWHYWRMGSFLYIFLRIYFTSV